jgi:hypothetical protein
LTAIIHISEVSLVTLKQSHALSDTRKQRTEKSLHPAFVYSFQRDNKKEENALHAF